MYKVKEKGKEKKSFKDAAREFSAWGYISQNKNVHCTISNFMHECCSGSQLYALSLWSIPIHLSTQPKILLFINSLENWCPNSLIGFINKCVCLTWYWICNIFQPRGVNKMMHKAITSRFRQNGEECYWQMKNCSYFCQQN